MSHLARAGVVAGLWGQAIVIACTMTAPALAEDAADKAPSANEAGSGTFPAEFFAPYNPVTAADMVARLPGFELSDGDDRRGFGGAAGNLLINGQRPSSKIAASDQLKRIPAANVARLELLSGNDSGVDVRGQAQLVNVVLLKGENAASETTYVVGLRHVSHSDRMGVTLQASRSFALSPNADLLIDIQTPNTRGRGVNHDVVRDAYGDLLARRDLYFQPNSSSLKASANLNWRATASDKINLNVEVEPSAHKTHIWSFESAPDGSLINLLAGDAEYDHDYTAEVGGDWDHAFSPDLSVKLVALSSFTSVEYTDVYNIRTPTVTGLVRTQGRTTDEQEHVLRSQFKWRATTAHTLELGLEGAFNARDTSLDITSQVGDGPLVHVPLAVADALVEEVRGEAFVTDIWTPTDTLTIETGFNFEASRITQTGDQEKEREFTYPKPRLSATWVASPRSTFRASVQRDVSQLDFTEFSSAVDFLNASSIQGNPDLVPEKAWKSRLEWETRFGRRGAFTLGAFHDRVEDVHDLVDIGGFDAYGNIGDGTRTGLDVKASMGLGFMGLRRAELRFNGLLQETSVTDPLTGETRSFSISNEREGSPSGAPVLNGGSKDWSYAANFRQELPALSGAWGLTVLQWSGRHEYRRAEIVGYERDEPRIDAFIETTRLRPVTIKLYVNNILPTTDTRQRSFYDTDRATGAIIRTETREVLGGPEGSRVIGVYVSGKF